MPSDAVREAVAAVARRLPANDPSAHAFFEAREDVRITLGSGGRRQALMTSSRGGVTAGVISAHESDPKHVSRSSVNPGQGELAPRMLSLEKAIVAAAARASTGRPNAAWLARLVAFHQIIWVGRPDMDAVSDVRRGCRIEVRAHAGRGDRATAVEDLVLDSSETAPIEPAFVRAFERAEARSDVWGVPNAGETVGVFASGVAGIVAHELIGHSLEGDVACQGRSWIMNGGLRSGPANVSVMDDPRLGRGAWLVDDEGTSSRVARLIDRGQRAGFLLDRSSAMALGTQPTGHGRRASHLDRVQPRMGCTYIESGEDDPGEILHSTSTGLFIRRLIGGHTDPVSGRATFVVEDADRIENGRLASPLDSFVIELDGPQSWMTIDRVANDLAFDKCVGSCVRGGQPLAVSVGAPTIRIGLIRVCA